MKQIRLWQLLCHCTIVLAGMFIVFFCIDRVNPAMDFLGSDMSKWLLLAFALCALGLAVMTLARTRAQIRRRLQHQRQDKPTP